MSFIFDLIEEKQDFADYIYYKSDDISELVEILLEGLGVVKEEIMNNPTQFIVPDNPEETKERIAIFTQGFISTLADIITNEMV